MNTTMTTSNEHIKETLIIILGSIAPEADYDELDPQADIQRALDIDSFDFLNFLIGIEEFLGINVPEADYGQLVSLNDVIVYITARL